MIDFIKSKFSRNSPVENRKQSNFDYSMFNQCDGVADFGVLLPSQAVNIYLRVAPVADAINMITDEFKSIEPVLYDKKSNSFIDDHPLLDLLHNPNTNMTYETFITMFGIFLYATGNNFMVATGPDNRAPLELYIIPAQDVSITQGGDGSAQSYFIDSGDTYSRPNGIRDRSTYRYFLENASGIRMSELWHSKLATPLSDTSNAFGTGLYGMSPLTPHHYNIQLYIESNVHNISVLRRGGVPSLILTLDSILDDDQRQHIVRQLESIHSGSNNAGRKLLIEGNSMNVSQLQSEARDMDFKALQKMITQDLFRAYKIPPALVAEDAMKFNNYKESRVTFYESSVLKKLDIIFSEIGHFLLPRYKNSENLRLTYNRNAIPELEPERMETLKTQRELGVLTINEIRRELHLEDAMGGDELYTASNMIPIADVSQTVEIPDQE